MSKNDCFLPPHVVNEYGPVLPQSQTIDWSINVLDIPKIHKEFGYRGKGMVAAVIDTGIDKDHPDLKGAISKIINVTAESMAASHGHGIGVAGLIGARDNNTGIYSVAPECQIIGIKAMRETGGGSLAEINKGIDAAIREGVDVINLSLGTTSDVPSLKAAVQRAVDAGIYVICSAGNAGGSNSVVYPARYPIAYAIGATNQAGNVSAFSSRGWEVDVAAPGERVLTSWKNKTFARVSGTSFSAPIVSGLFLLFKEAGIDMTHKIIQETSIDIEEPGQDQKSGHGLIDPYKIISKYGKPKDSEDPKDPCPSVNLDKIIEARDLLSKFISENQ